MINYSWKIISIFWWFCYISNCFYLLFFFFFSYNIERRWILSYNTLGISNCFCCRCLLKSLQKWGMKMLLHIKGPPSTEGLKVLYAHKWLLTIAHLKLVSHPLSLARYENSERKWYVNLNSLANTGNEAWVIGVFMQFFWRPFYYYSLQLSDTIRQMSNTISSIKQLRWLDWIGSKVD